MDEINLFYILSALVFGMIHSMEPGHGKSLIATFVLSSSSTKKRDAFFIGLLASLTHTASVYIIGYLSIRAIGFISPEHKELIVGFAASGIIFTIGSYLMWDRIIKPLFKPKHEHDCSVHKVLTKNIKAKSFILVGLTAGLIPCSGGLAVFMTVTAVNGTESVIQGFIYVLSYSIGLGLALTLVALSTIYSQGFLKKVMDKSLGNIEKSSGVISAIIIYTIGLILLTANIAGTVTHKKHNYHNHHHIHIPAN